MAYLKKAEYERFAQAIARGTTEDGKHLSQKAAAIEAGYSPATAGVTGSKLYARPEIKARVEEIKKTLERRNAKVEAQIITTLAISKTDVMRQLWKEATDDENSASARIRALEVMWKDFVLLERQGGMDLPDSPDQCTDAQLLQIQKFFLKWIYGNDEKRMREAERRLALEHGLVIEATAAVEAPGTVNVTDTAEPRAPEVTPRKKNDPEW